MALESRRPLYWLLTIALCSAPLMLSCARCQSVGGVDELAEGVVPVGEHITVRLVDGRRVAGVFEGVARDTLFCRYRSFPVDAVESVEVCELSAADTAKVVGSAAGIIAGFVLAAAAVWWFYVYLPLTSD